MREEEKKQPSRKIGIQRFFKKRWVYPAVYILAAAIILTSFLWFQDRAKNADDPEFGYDNNPGRNGDNDGSVEVNVPLENFKWPVANEDEVEVKTPFYESTLSAEDQEAAILTYGNSFQPNTGIAIVAKSGESFEVLAAMSGTVTAIEEDSVLGNVIILEHADGVQTRYQALKDIQVSVGDKVKQGQTLAYAGKSLLNEDAGEHVHFEIRKNDVPVNPISYFEKSLASLVDGEEDSSKVTNEEDEDADEDEDQKDSNEDENDANPETDAS